MKQVNPSRENQVQRVISVAMQRVLSHERCCGPNTHKCGQLCITGALGLVDNCVSALEGTGGCEAIRLVADAPVEKGAWEAARLIAAEVQTRWAEEHATRGEELDYFSLDATDFDIEILGDFTCQTHDRSEVVDVLGVAYERAGQDFDRQN